MIKCILNNAKYYLGNSYKYANALQLRKGSKKMNKNIGIIKDVKSQERERTLESAIELADTLIKKLGIQTYPVPIVDILNSIGFNIYVGRLPENLSGLICITPDFKEKYKTDRIITIADKDAIGRQRFTLAHEFAHFLLDFNENKDFQYADAYDIDKSDEECESIPSRFAAEFLMPKDMFIKRYEELKESGETLYNITSQLATDFNVSYKAVIKRFGEIEELAGVANG